MQNKQQTKRAWAAAATLAAGVLGAGGAQAAPTAASGYSLHTFGAAPSGATNPDSIAVSGSHVFVGYAGTAGKSGGGVSTIAEFNQSGALQKTFTVSGHNDGLKVDPKTGDLWAIQNEDGNPNLAIINTAQGTAKTYTLPAVNGGGFDDVVFRQGQTFLSASNASQDPNTDPAIVQATFANNAFTFTPVLLGNATATNTATGAATTLDLTDADSLTLTPGGGLLLTDQTANQLVTVTNPATAGQSATVVGTTSGGVSLPVDDTIFTGGAPGSLLVSDTNSNAVYAIDGPFTGGVFSAAPDNGFVGALDLNSGVLTPIATGFTAPKGMAYLPSAVPEPSTLAAFGAGACLLLVCLGKRRRLPAA